MNYYTHTSADFSGVKTAASLPIVYVIATDDFKYIKIGKTGSPRQRFINIQSGCPFNISIWRSIKTPKTTEIEKFLHERMKHCRTRGEWFQPSSADLDYLSLFFDLTNANAKEVLCALL